MRYLLVVVSLISTATAQYNWFSPPLTVVPPPRDTHAMATEPVSGKVILFGGVVNDTNQLNDTWEWDGVSWTLAQPNVSPSARESHWMAPDGQGGIIMFGGHAFLGGGTLNDTWRYYQGQWTHLFPATNPPPRRYHRMVFTGQSILLFGGFQGSPTTGNRSDTWEWNGSNWVQRFPSTVPLARSSFGLTYDSARSRAVMFGGRAQNDQRPQDTWEWDGSNWIQRSPTHVPTDAAWIAYDPVAALTVSYGGFNMTLPTPPAIAESWAWDGNDWAQLTLVPTNPGARFSPIVWSPLSGGLLLHGGHAPTNQTWITAPAGPSASYTLFGSGCLGPNGTVPALVGLPGEPPRIGTTTRVQVTNLPLALTLPVFFFGRSNTMQPGSPSYPLPANLSVLGWPGCEQLVSADVSFFEITNTGQAEHSIDVPLNLMLVGQEFHAQVFALYFPTGVAVSNGLTGVMGF